MFENEEHILSLLKAGKDIDARAIANIVSDNDALDFLCLKERINRQNSYGPHHAFDVCGSNWKSYFFQFDGLHNTNDDIVFSIFNRYMCDINCPTCYLKDYWMSKPEFSQYVPERINEKILLNIFDHFYRVGCIDDLRLIKDEYPEFMEFYKKYASLMEHNITDNGFFSQYDIIMNDCKFAYIAYLSFSDVVLNKKNGAIVEKIIPMIDALHKRSPIRKINFILSEGLVTENKNILSLANWIVSNTDIETFFHTDLCKDTDNVSDLKIKYNYDLPSIYYQENSYNPPIICQILTETIQMRGLNFYSTLTGSTVSPKYDARVSLPFYTCDEAFELDSFLLGILNSKIETYDFYQDVLKHKNGNRYWEYFNWCSTNLKTNKNFTFIPISLLKPSSNMYKKLIDGGMYSNTYVGLIKKGATTVIPIVEVKS